jgi:uncharacterized membrane protein
MERTKVARIIVIIFAILGLIGAIFKLINGQWSSIISLIINGVIGYYLLFSKSVKAAFAYPANSIFIFSFSISSVLL